MESKLIGMYIDALVDCFLRCTSHIEFVQRAMAIHPTITTQSLDEEECHEEYLSDEEKIKAIMLCLLYQSFASNRTD